MERRRSLKRTDRTENEKIWKTMSRDHDEERKQLKLIFEANNDFHETEYDKKLDPGSGPGKWVSLGASDIRGIQGCRSKSLWKD